MKKQLIKLTENDLHKIISNSVKRIIKEGFEDDYNTAKDNHLQKGGMWGMEARNSEGDWFKWCLCIRSGKLCRYCYREWCREELHCNLAGYFEGQNADCQLLNTVWQDAYADDC